MQDSLAEHDFYGNHGMHYMGNSAITTTPCDAEEDYIKALDFHLGLQERYATP